MGSVIRVAVVDDHELILEGFESWISKAPGFKFAGKFHTVAALVASGVTLDAVVLDVHLADRSLPAANVRDLKAKGAAVVVVSGDEDSLTVISCIEAGADGYLRKGDSLEMMTDAIRTALSDDNDLPISPVLAFILSRDRRGGRPHLTAREKEILEYVGSGLPWSRVAARLGIGHETIKVHLRNIRTKYRNAGSDR